MLAVADHFFVTSGGHQFLAVEFIKLRFIGAPIGDGAIADRSQALDAKGLEWNAFDDVSADGL